MSEKYYIALGLNAARRIDEMVDDGNLSSGILQQEEEYKSIVGKKEVDVFSIDFSDTSSKAFVAFKTKILKASGTVRESYRNNPIASSLNSLLEELENPDGFRLTIPAGKNSADKLKALFKSSCTVEKEPYSDKIDEKTIYRVTLKFSDNPDEITGEQLEALRTFHTSFKDQLAQKKFNTDYYNLYLFAEKILSKKKPPAETPEAPQRVPITLDQTFKYDVLKSDIPVLVDFWADRCEPCKIMDPIIEDLNTEYTGKIKVYKLNIGENPKTAATYGKGPIPRFVLFNNGYVIAVHSGTTTKENLKSIIDAELSKITDIPESRDSFESKYDELGEQYRKKALELSQDVESHLAEDGNLKVEMSGSDIKAKLEWLAGIRQDFTYLQYQYCLLGHQAESASEDTFHKNRWWYWIPPVFLTIPWLWHSNDADNRDIFIKSCEIAIKSINEHIETIDKYGQILIKKLKPPAPSSLSPEKQAEEMLSAISPSAFPLTMEEIRGAQDRLESEGQTVVDVVGLLLMKLAETTEYNKEHFKTILAHLITQKQDKQAEGAIKVLEKAVAMRNEAAAPAPQPEPRPEEASAPKSPLVLGLGPAPSDNATSNATRPPAPTPAGQPDTDKDSVSDSKDRCPNTPKSPPTSIIGITTNGCLNSWDHPDIKKVIVSRSGVGFKKRGLLQGGGTFDGTYKAVYIIPDLEKAIKLFTGENTGAFNQLPGVVSADYRSEGGETGVLTYFLHGNITKVSVPFSQPIIIELGALGYKIKTTVDRSHISSGIVKVSWSNAGDQPTRRPTDGDTVSNFSSNNGYWKLTKITGYDPPLYEVEWHATTNTNDDSLPTGSGFLPESTVSKNSWKAIRETVEKAGYIVRKLY